MRDGNRTWLKGEVLEQQLSYWKKQLQDVPEVHSVPLDRPRVEKQTFDGASYELKIDRATLDAVKRLAREGQASLYMVLHGVVALLLSRYAYSSDIVIGTEVANRMQKEVESLVGFFVNTLRVLQTGC